MHKKSVTACKAIIDNHQRRSLVKINCQTYKVDATHRIHNKNGTGQNIISKFSIVSGKNICFSIVFLITME